MSGSYIQREYERDHLQQFNRKIAIFAMIQCWVKNLDGVVFSYSDLTRLYMVNSLKQSRLDIFIEDIGGLFPHCKILANYQRNRKLHKEEMKYASVWACRMPFKDVLPSGAMSTDERVQKMKGQRPAFDQFHLWPEPGSDEFIGMTMENPFFGTCSNRDDEFLSAYLKGVADGRIGYDAIPPFEGRMVRVKADE